MGNRVIEDSTLFSNVFRRTKNTLKRSEHKEVRDENKQEKMENNFQIQVFFCKSHDLRVFRDLLLHLIFRLIYWTPTNTYLPLIRHYERIHVFVFVSSKKFRNLDSNTMKKKIVNMTGFVQNFENFDTRQHFLHKNCLEMYKSLRGHICSGKLAKIFDWVHKSSTIF